MRLRITRKVNMANNNAYSIGQPLRSVFPSPIIQKFDPKASNNQYQLGQVWVNQATQIAFMLTFISPSTGANWTQITAGGGDGLFTNLTVTNNTSLDKVAISGSLFVDGIVFPLPIVATNIVSIKV